MAHKLEVAFVQGTSTISKAISKVSKQLIMIIILETLYQVTYY